MKKLQNQNFFCEMRSYLPSQKHPLPLFFLTAFILEKPPQQPVTGQITEAQPSELPVTRHLCWKTAPQKAHLQLDNFPWLPLQHQLYLLCQWIKIATKVSHFQSNEVLKKNWQKQQSAQSLTKLRSQKKNDKSSRDHQSKNSDHTCITFSSNNKLLLLFWW